VSKIKKKENLLDIVSLLLSCGRSKEKENEQIENMMERERESYSSNARYSY